MQARFAVSTLLIAAACLYGAAPASAQGNTGFYLEGNLGYAFPDSVDASASGVDGEVELKDAFVFGGALGYRWPWVRLEVNGSYIGPIRGVERLWSSRARWLRGRPWLNPLSEANCVLQVNRSSLADIDRFLGLALGGFHETHPSPRRLERRGSSSPAAL